MKTKKKTNVAFWDTSAIVPLCCQQNLSYSLRKLWRETAHVIVWGGITGEIRSAISRLHGEGGITAKGRQQALARLEVLRQEWRAAPPSGEAGRAGGGLAGDYEGVGR